MYKKIIEKIKHWSGKLRSSDGKWWLMLVFIFLSERAIIFWTLWRASADKGGWQNFYNLAQSAPATLLFLFHERCDWHPPLYYAFASSINYIFNGTLYIYLFQILLAFLALIVAYKIARLFFSVRISRFAVLLLAIEPYSALHNLLLANENLSIPLFLLGIYFYLKFVKSGGSKNLYFSAIVLGIATMTRPNYLLLGPILAIFLLVIYFGRRLIGGTLAQDWQLKKIFIASAAYALLFFAALAPWTIRNQIIYGRFTIATILSTNLYFYNYSTLTAVKDHLSAGDAHKKIIAQADAALGSNVGDQGNCLPYTKADFNRQLDYYEIESKKALMDNFWLYLKIHLVKAVPFFLQPGYLEMYATYTGDWAKPDMSGAVLAGDLGTLKRFLFEVNPKLIIYLAGILFWLLADLALLFSLIYSYLKDRGKFIFFLFASMIIVYEALLVAAVFSARYRFPYYIFFFVALAYSVSIAVAYFKSKKYFLSNIKIFIRKLPFIAGFTKRIYDSWLENMMRQRVKKFLVLSKLPFTDRAPVIYSVGHEPTMRCNLRCKMCYQGQTRAQRGEELTTEEVLIVYGKLKGRVEDIKLVGGEPMVRQDIFELISFWNGAGVGVILQTNCTLISQENISKLKELKNVTDVLTSLDGPKSVHDAIRGVPGTFERLKESIRLIRQEMPQVPITVFATVLINDNLDRFFELIDTANKLGLGTINVLFEQVYSRGDIEQAREKFKLWGWENGEGYRLNTQERSPIFNADLNIRKIKKQLAKIRNYGIKKGCFVNFTPFNFYKNLEQYFQQDGSKRVFCLKLLQPELRINQKGDVVWCDVIEKSFGNLLEKTPDEIWLSPEYQNFRKLLLNQSLPICSRCCKAFYY